MIQCDICRQDGMVVGFEIEGHAGAGEYGSDIVCAGVSAIVLGALGSLQEMFGIEDFEGVDPDDEDGHVKFHLSDEFSEDKSRVDSIKIAAILDAMVIGLRQIEMQYSDYITVTEREV